MFIIFGWQKSNSDEQYFSSTLGSKCSLHARILWSNQHILVQSTPCLAHFIYINLTYLIIIVFIDSKLKMVEIQSSL